MNIELPNFQEFKISEFASKVSWSENYGAHFLLERILNKKIALEDKRNYYVWQHGVFGPWDNIAPSNIVYNHQKNEDLFLVARKDQVDVLKRFGYKNTYAIGMPILYEKTINVSKVQNSCLYMPTHTLVGESGPSSIEVNDVISILKILKNDFKHVVVSINYNDFLNGYWINELENADIQYIIGARTDDRNALLRMQMIFKSFETIVTNGYGSHIAYALYFGCKLSIIEKNFNTLRDQNNLKFDSGYLRNPTAYLQMFSKQYENCRQNYLNEFYVLPKHAKSNIEMGKYLLGEKNKKASWKLKYIFFINNLIINIKLIKNHGFSIVLVKLKNKLGNI